MTQIGIEKRKTRAKKIRGDLFSDAPFHGCLFMIEPPCHILGESGAIVRVGAHDVMPQTGNPAGEFEGKKGGKPGPAVRRPASIV
jgi:hypothetical protein